MSPKNIIKLKKIRKKLDKLDNSFIKLIKKRTTLVKEVLKLKENKNQIIDQKRIKFILNQIRKKSLKNKIDPKITNRIWKNMIYSYIDFERRNFKKKLLLTMRWKFFFNKNLMFSSCRIIFFCF